MLRMPTIDLVHEYIDKFNDDENAALTDQALARVVECYPRNDELATVLLKVTAINALYYTNVQAIVALARHIHAKSIDQRLASGDPILVDDIACLTLTSGKCMRFYSFATKYCHWHNPKAYPIYDQYVDWLLRRYNKESRFDKFTAVDLRHYPRFKAIVEAFREHFGLQACTFKEIDKFLWLYGKQMKLERASPSEHPQF
jgi:hypothetical protein